MNDLKDLSGRDSREQSWIENFEGIQADIFSYTKSDSRRLYKAPSDRSENIIINKETKIPGFESESRDYTFGSFSSAFYLGETKGNFTQLIFKIFDYEKTKTFNIGWIKIRDNEGALTVWSKYIAP